jgi:serine/threonine protein kinase
VLCTSALQPCLAALAAVLQAIDRQSNTHVALKVYHTSRLHELNRYQVLREVYLHAHLQHVNIIQMYAAFQVRSLPRHAFGRCWERLQALLNLGVNLKRTTIVGNLVCQVHACLSICTMATQWSLHSCASALTVGQPCFSMCI